MRLHLHARVQHQEEHAQIGDRGEDPVIGQANQTGKPARRKSRKASA